MSLSLALLATALAGPPPDPLLVDQPVVGAAYPHERFGPTPGGFRWIEAQLSTLLLAHALDHLIYMDMPPPPGELPPEPSASGLPPGVGGPPPGPAGQPIGPPGPPPRKGPPNRIPRTAPRTRRRWRVAAALALSALSACAALAPPEAHLEGRTWSTSGLSITFPANWVVATDPAHFRSGLDHALLEGRRGDLQLVIGFVRRPDGGPSGALDGLLELTPEPIDPVTVRRLQNCSGAVERTIGKEPLVVQIAVAVPEGLVIAEAWGAPDGAAHLQALLCGGARP